MELSFAGGVTMKRHVKAAARRAATTESADRRRAAASRRTLANCRRHTMENFLKNHFRLHIILIT